MASTYTPALRIEDMATGDQSGTWGDTTDNNYALFEQAITGFLSVAQGDVANLTLTSLDGAIDQARNAVLDITGAMTANRNVVVPTSEKVYLFKNSTTGGFIITVKTVAGTGVTIPNGTARWVYCDGTNVVDALSGPWTPSANDGQALGASGTAWADLFLASGGVINWNAGNYTLTHSAGLLTTNGALTVGGAATASTFVPNSSSAPTDGMYLPAASTLGWSVGSAAEMQLTSTALSPAADGGSSLGTTALGWQNLFGNTGFVLNIEGGNWVATHTSGIMTVGTGDLRVTTAGTNTASVATVGGTQTLTAKTLTSPTITTSPTAAGATWTDLGSVTTVDINGGTADGVVIGGASAAAGTFTTATANAFVPNSSSVPTNGLYLPAANTLGWAVNSAAEMQLTATALSPAADGGNSLGTTALGWQNLFGNTGFVLNIENSDWVATHTAGILTVGTGDLRVTTAGTNTASAVTVGGTQTLTSKTMTSPVLNTPTVGTTITPTSNDGAALGTTALMWSDLFLASGGVINWNNGDVTITHSANTLAFAGASSGYRFDANIIATADLNIVQSTSDGSDNRYTTINGGGASIDTRGALAQFFGNEFASNPGELYIQTGKPNGTDYSPGYISATPLHIVLGQLRFPATQNASSNANTLDDYEEGTWTPGVAFGGGTTGLTYSSQVGLYVKVGKNVTCTAYITMSAKGSSAGGATLTGLPFTAQNTANAYGGFTTSYASNFTLTGTLGGYVIPNTTTCDFNVVNNGSVTASSEANFNNTSQLIITICYVANA